MTGPETSPVLLSICIATYNRAGFIGQTLESIIAQWRPGVEIVIVDGASPDDTRAVVASYAARCPAIRYMRENTNSGVDADYDKAVGYAAGRHCWLLPDDDLIAPNAIDRVLTELEGGAIDLMIVDSEVRDVTLSQILETRRLRFGGLRRYGPADRDAFLRDAGYSLSFIGGVVIRREAWTARRREPYFGSLFIHVGVIVQDPPLENIKILGEPLVRIRLGNAMWKPRTFEIWAFKWPSLIWSFAGYADSAKKRVSPREPWRNPVWLLFYRAMGAYSRREYDLYLSNIYPPLSILTPLLIAYFPGRFANLIGVVLLSMLGRGKSGPCYDLIASSIYSNRLSRLWASVWLGDLARSPT